MVSGDFDLCDQTLHVGCNHPVSKSWCKLEAISARGILCEKAIHLRRKVKKNGADNNPRVLCFL